MLCHVCCVVLCCVVLCCVLCLVRPSVVVVRRRRPSSSSCESKAACKFSKNYQDMSPIASGLLNSDRARSGDFFSRPEIAVLVEKVGFTAETLLL